MSLTSQDLIQIREVVEGIFDRKLEPIIGGLEALENDIKEIYFMIERLEKGAITDKNFRKLSVEEKLLKLNAELLAAAKQAGITLPR